MSKNNTSKSPIAIVGASALFPGSLDETGFWKDVLAGNDLITDVPPGHWLIEDYYDPDPSAPDKTYARRGAFLDKVSFNPMSFGVPPNIMPATDTSQLLGLIVAQKVLEDAGQGQFEGIDRERMSCILGVTSGQELLGSMVSRLQRPVWLKALRDAGVPEAKAQEVCERISDEYVPWQESTFPGLLGNVVAGRIANRFDLGGTNCVTDAACASAFSAVAMGVSELQLGTSDVVITGGVDTLNDIFMFMCFSKTPALSASGDCRPFSDQADGTMLGEGLAMVALKRLEDAEKAGDRIYGVIQGVGSSSDGRAKSVYAPRPEGQARALSRAYEAAGYSPGTVELVEAHGTGTKAGDVAEFAGLELAFNKADRSDRQWCALGTVKSQIGHTKAAAGAAGLFKAVMALHHKVLPPTIKVDRPNPKIDLENSPFYINTETRPWVRGTSHPRRAGISSFGFGGSNFHVTVEEYTGKGTQAWRRRTANSELVLLGADSPAALVAELRATKVAGNGFLRWFARHSQENFSHGHSARVAIVASDEAALEQRLQTAADLIEKTPDEAFSNPMGIHYGNAPVSGGVAFLFSGQGSQYLNMGSEAAITWPECMAAWDLAADIDMGEEQRLHDVVFPKTVFCEERKAEQKATLVKTQWAQPAIGTVSLSLLNLLKSMGLNPDCVGGHSYGEITALHAAGAIDAETMLRIARKRGELMNEAAKTPGAMTAAVATVETLRDLLKEAGSDVVIANHNSPEQVVLSGTTDSIEAFESVLADKGIKAKRLSVATAFHSKVVSASVDPFKKYLSKVKFKNPELPVYANSEAAPYPKTAAKMRSILANQIANPVRFVEQIEAMYAAGVRTFVEVGPGSVLTNLVGRILADRSHTAINMDRKGQDGSTSIANAFGQLTATGVQLDFAPTWQTYKPEVDPRTLEEASFAIDIDGTCYGKPYPPEGGAKDLPAPNPEPAPVVAPAAPPAPVAAAPAAPDVAAAPAVAPAVSAPVAPAPALPVQDSAGWVTAYQEAQRQTADAHAAYQNAMAQTHMAFLQAMERSYNGLNSMVSGQAPALPAVSAPAAFVPHQPVATPAPVVVQPAVVPTPAPVVAPPVVAEPVQATAPAPVAAPVPEKVAPAAAPAQDLQGLLMAVVAEKTGYPSEMLTLEMSLEADLGIDSIKWVEILAEISEREPNLPEVDTTMMADLRTLGQIVEFMNSKMGAVSAPVASAPAAAAPTPQNGNSAASSASGGDLKGLLFEVVAEKTGYPAEMLTLEMGLEADLGIDSIKWVEILSEISDREPNLPEVDTTMMADLRTLGQIVDFMNAKMGVVQSTAAPAASPAAAPANGNAGSNGGAAGIKQLLFDVVAEKTGYPAEMLTLEMGLEADLGIDSIKWVEILSEISDREPNLPEVDTTMMAELRSLGQIVEFMENMLGGAPAPAGNDVGGNGNASPPDKPGVGRYSLDAVDAPSAGLAMGGLTTAGNVAITDDQKGVAKALAKKLNALGHNANVVASVPSDVDAVIVLNGLRACERFEDAALANKEAFDAANAVAGAFTEKNGGVFVTVQDTGGDFGLSGSKNAWLSGFSGLVKTAAIEWSGASVKAIDIERGKRSASKVADAIVAELYSGGPEVEVGLSAKGRRITLKSVASEVQSKDDSRLKNSVLVASGGARGVTAATLIALAKAHQPKMVLLGRTELSDEPSGCQDVSDDAGLKRRLMEIALKEGRKIAPAALGSQVRRILSVREIKANIAAMEAAGSTVRYLSVDVQDAEALGSALDKIRKDWGAITGLLHGAGVLADKLIADKTKEQFDRVFDTKVGGLKALLDATSMDSLNWICLFSSVAARSGNSGQCDYAMANEILNKVAAQEAANRGADCVVKSLNWGPWEGGMVTPALKAHFEAAGIPLVSLDGGAQMMLDELSDTSRNTIEVVLGPAPVRSGLSAASGALQATFDVAVGAESHSYLSDHSIQGVPVVPLVLVLEWFVRAARATRPDLELTNCRDIKVLKGVQLTDFDQSRACLSVTCKQMSNGDGAILALELRGSDDTLYYTGIAEMGAHRPVPSDDPPADIALNTWDAPVYGDVLFHGPGFQVIKALAGVANEGIEAEIAGISDVEWGDGSWQVDIAALDGGLQLALLWGQHALGGHSLPMALGRYQSFTAGPVKGTVRCILRGQPKGKSRGLSHIWFVDSEGRLLAELTDVETVRLPAKSEKGAVQPASTAA